MMMTMTMVTAGANEHQYREIISYRCSDAYYTHDVLYLIHYLT